MSNIKFLELRRDIQGEKTRAYQAQKMDSKPKFTGIINTKFKKTIDFFELFLYNKNRNKRKRKERKMSNGNEVEKVTSKKNKSNKNTFNRSAAHAIMGIVKLFVVVSIAYSSWVIVQGTDDMVHRIMIVPMVLWAAIQLIMQFTKQGDE